MFVDLIAGARPNFVKIAAIVHAFRELPEIKLGYRIVHTGQHYDKRMSGDFFEQLEIPEPDFNLEVGSGTQAEQTARIMMRYEELIMAQPPAATLVVGDVTSTMACAIVAQKQGIPVAHVEAGIRSGDWTMPEEINRLVTDSITNWFFTTSEVANAELRRTGVAEDRIFFVGNTMIDTLFRNRHKFKKPDCFPTPDPASPRPSEATTQNLGSPFPTEVTTQNSGSLLPSEVTTQNLGSPRPSHSAATESNPRAISPFPSKATTQNLGSPRPSHSAAPESNPRATSPFPTEATTHNPGSPRPLWGRGAGGEGALTRSASENYLLLTLHRPSNVDDPVRLSEILREIAAGASGTPIIFPVHPRTRQKLESAGIQLSSQYIVVEPLPYLEFGYLIEHARGIITDSGGITEEATVLGIPCMTLRNSTERPETIDMGTNELIGSDPKSIRPALTRLLSGNWKTGQVPPLWDGQTGKRIVTKMSELLIQKKLEARS